MNDIIRSLSTKYTNLRKGVHAREKCEKNVNYYTFEAKSNIMGRLIQYFMRFQHHFVVLLIAFGEFRAAIHYCGMAQGSSTKPQHTLL